MGELLLARGLPQEYDLACAVMRAAVHLAENDLLLWQQDQLTLAGNLRTMVEIGKALSNNAGKDLLDSYRTIELQNGQLAGMNKALYRISGDNEKMVKELQTNLKGKEETIGYLLEDARDLLDEKARMERVLRDVITIPAVIQALGDNHTGGCNCPLCEAKSILNPIPKTQE